MLELREYRGHIRNRNALCGELNIPINNKGGESGKETEKEIILKAYEKWGGQMADHIYGMFAFAIHDTCDNSWFCLRDQFGTKPFYYAVTEEGNLLCGTFIRDILKKGYQKELNEDLLQIYMSLTYIPGEDTLFKGIKKLLPGRFLVYKDGKAEVTRYFKPEFHPDNEKSLEDWASEIHETVTEIMKEMLAEDEKADSFLSGGVDSSYVLAAGNAGNADAVGYDDERFDESPLAAETAKLLGRSLSRCRVTPEEYFAIVPWVMENMELPLGDASAIAFALGARATAEHASICYSGEGSDEFFGGYNAYRNAERYGDNLKTFYVGNTNIMKEPEKQELLKYYNEKVLPIDYAASIYEEAEEYDPLTKMSDVDIQIWLEGDIYLNVDKMSTAAGLEVRMPLTDLRVFDIASRIPSKYKVNEEQNKVAFRWAASKLLPQEVAFRKKLGFVVPIRHWMADDKYNKPVRDALFGKTSEKFFYPEKVKEIWDEYKGGNSDLWRKLWTIYTFVVWYDCYFKD